jgi:hypothetical protein
MVVSFPAATSIHYSDSGSNILTTNICQHHEANPDKQWPTCLARHLTSLTPIFTRTQLGYTGPQVSPGPLVYKLPKSLCVRQRGEGLLSPSFRGGKPGPWLTRPPVQPKCLNLAFV